MNSQPASVVENALFQFGTNTQSTQSFLAGSTVYTLSVNEPFIGARTFTFNPARAQSGAVGPWVLPIAQLRGLTQQQFLDFYALPNLTNQARNNAITLVLVPPGPVAWSGIAGPITNATGPNYLPFWGNGGGTQYYFGNEVLGRSPSTPPFQLPNSNFLFPTQVNDGLPVLQYGPRLSGNAAAIGSYLDQRCVTAYSDLDRVLTSLDVLNLGNPNDPGPLAAAVNQLSPDRYGALPLIIGHQQSLILDAFGGRLDATRWPYADAHVKQQTIAPGVLAWARWLGDFGRRDDSSTMPGYRTNTGGGLAGIGYDGGNFVLGIGGGYLTSRVTWNDLGQSTGNVGSGVLGAYGSMSFGYLLIDGAVAGTYSSVDVNRQIAIPDSGLIPGFSTAVSRAANGTTQAPGVAARLDFGANLQGYTVAVKPFVGLSYGWLDRHGFTETNAGAIDLTLPNQISDGLRSRLGAVAYYELLHAGPLAWALQGNLVWTHRLAASSGDITAGLVGYSDSFTIQTVQDDRDSLQPGLALIANFPGGDLYVRYDGDFRQDFRSHAIMGGMAIQFWPETRKVVKD